MQSLDIFIKYDPHYTQVIIKLHVQCLQFSQEILTLGLGMEVETLLKCSENFMSEINPDFSKCLMTGFLKKKCNFPD